MNNDSSDVSYNDFLEQLKMNFSDFMRMAEAGRSVRHSALLARKKSIKIREMLKEFRNVSLTQDKRITDILQKAKEEMIHGTKEPDIYDNE